jgi:hypothetical protein
MEKPITTRKIIMLWIMVLVAIIYSIILLTLGTLTGRPIIDGSIGVVLGLYICSHPAANAIDLLFMDRTQRYQLTSGGSALRWVGLNLLVLVAGWFVIFLGAIRFANRAG